jgi:hypothetical protein
MERVFFYGRAELTVKRLVNEQSSSGFHGNAIHAKLLPTQFVNNI